MTASVTSNAHSRASSNLSLLMDEYNALTAKSSRCSSGDASKRSTRHANTISSDQSLRNALVTSVSQLSSDEDDDNSTSTASLVGSYVSYTETNPSRAKRRSSSCKTSWREHPRESQHALGVSPLTNSSYQTLERLYELDTQRMRDRILSGRTIDTIQPRQHANQPVMANPGYDIVDYDHDDQDEILEMFDLDMD